MKPAAAHRGRGALPAFPRQRCLGYIEASRDRREKLEVGFRDFRGNAASATLKLGRRGTRASGTRHFRGNAASATLKLQEWLFPISRLRHFRGNAASATLKLQEWLFPISRLRYFRGNAASATLKPWDTAPLSSRSLSFPRQRCLGYIEALVNKIPGYAPTLSFPRQRCLGYIEAPRRTTLNIS